MGQMTELWGEGAVESLGNHPKFGDLFQQIAAAQDEEELFDEPGNDTTPPADEGDPNTEGDYYPDGGGGDPQGATWDGGGAPGGAGAISQRGAGAVSRGKKKGLNLRIGGM